MGTWGIGDKWMFDKAVDILKEADEKREKSRFPTRKFFSLSADSVGTLGEYYKKSERV